MAKAKASAALRDPTKYRTSQGKNQTEFWRPLGVTQSGGSRYESGRVLPAPAAMLLVLREQGVVTDDMLEEAMRTVKASRRKG